MAYTYADWRTYTDASARLTRLNLHITEVTQQMGPEISADGKSRGSSSVQQYLDMLHEIAGKLEERVGRSSAGGLVTQIRMNRVGGNGGCCADEPA